MEVKATELEQEKDGARGNGPEEIPNPVPGSMRIIYNNCNGLQMNEYVKAKIKENKSKKEQRYLAESSQYTKIRGIVGIMKDWSANVLCLSETQTAWESAITKTLMSKELRRVDQYATMVGSSSDIKSASLVKPGGTMMCNDGTFGSRIIEKGRDPSGLGRWTYCSYVGKNNTKLIVICGYRCCSSQRMNNVGITTAYAQQFCLLRSKGYKNPNPQEQYIKDISKFIKEKLKKDFEVLLCMDANEEMMEKNSKICEMTQKLGLHDLAKEYHQTPPATYTRGDKERRIDFMLGTKAIMESMTLMVPAPKSVGNIMGDHRAMIIDLNITKLLGLHPNEPVAPSSRLLKSTDARAVKKYVTKLKENYETHNIYNRLKTLCMELDGRTNITKFQTEQYEALDRDIYRSCLNAEKESKKLNNGRYWWSPKLDQAGIILQYWQRRKKHFRNAQETELLVSEHQPMGTQDSTSLTWEELEDQIHESGKTLCTIQKQDKEYRVQYLLEIAGKYASDHDISRETAIRDLLYHEELRDTFRKIAAKLKQRRSPQLTEIWIKNGDDKIVLDTSETVEEHILNRNKYHLQKANETPFACGNMSQYLGTYGDNHFVEKVLMGQETYETNESNKPMKDYLKTLQYAENVTHDSVNTNITIEEYKKFWKKKREITATSPFGLHIGHYKSVLQHDDILESHLQMMVIPFKYGYAQKKLCKTVQIMLEKNPGSPWTHRLRIIELFDSQLNAAMQIVFGKRMVYNALDNGAVHPSAFGSVPGRNAQEALLEKTMTFDMMRIRRANGAIYDCDAEGCYDRINPKFSSVHTRRLGMPKNWALFFAIFWSQCSHYVKTKYGISNDAFQAGMNEFLHGIGQGNGAGPALWLSHLIVMFWTLEKHLPGWAFTSPDGLTTFDSPGTGFVDDVTLGASADETLEYEDQEEHLVGTISKIASYWEKMLHTNGGKLELSKCFWVLISWKWKRGIPTMKLIQDSDAEMKITQSGTGNQVQISRKEVNEAPKVLGCHMSADGKWTEEFARWRLASHDFGHKVRKAKFDRISGAKIHPIMWIPKFRYIAPIVGFNKDQCDEIDKPIMRQCLPAMGLNRNFPRFVIFGSHQYSGLHLESAYTVKTYEKIRFLIKNVRKNTRLGKLMKILIETIQIFAGIKDNILNTTTDWTIWTPVTWFTDLWMDLKRLKGGIYTSFEKMEQGRTYDRFLMEIFVKMKLTKKELIHVNTCRLYLQVTTLSDIATYDGTKIEETILECIQTRQHSQLWPNQIYPTLSARNCWKNSILKLCSTNNTLITTLGPWIRESKQIWPFTLEMPSRRLLHNLPTGQVAYYKNTSNIYPKTGALTGEHINGYPIKTTITPTGYKIVSENLRCIPACRLYENLNHTLKWASDSTGHITCNRKRDLATTWKSGENITIGTDGGLKGDVGTTGVIIESSMDATINIQAMSAEQGKNKDLHSTREELRALLSAELILDKMGSIWGTEKNINVTFICDSKSALHFVDSALDPKYKERDVLGPEADIIMAIDKLKENNKHINRDYKWVRSHQKDGEPMTNDRRINDIADRLATKCRDEANEDLIELPRKQFFPDSKIALHIKGNIVSRNLKEAVHQAVNDENLKKFLKGKYDWTDDTFNSIDWNAISAVLYKKPMTYVISITKLIHRWQPTNKVVARYTKGKTTSNCCLCENVEHQHHYMTCTHNIYKTARKNAWLAFKRKMKKWQINDDVFRYMWYGLKSWSEEEEIPDLEELRRSDIPQAEKIITAFQEQTKIGWKHFALGRVTKIWKQLFIDNFRKDNYPEEKAEAAMKALVEALWAMMLTVWKKRNDVEHGENLAYSKKDLRMIDEIIDKIYMEIKNKVSEKDSWIFEKSADERKKDTIINTITWIEIVYAMYILDKKETEELRLGTEYILHRICVGSIFS